MIFHPSLLVLYRRPATAGRLFVRLALLVLACTTACTCSSSRLGSAEANPLACPETYPKKKEETSHA